MFVAQKWSTLLWGLSVALTSKGLLAGSLGDADSLQGGDGVELLDSDRCCQQDILALGCMVVVEALGVVPARIQSVLAGRTVEYTVAGGVPLALSRFPDMVERIQPCPFPS